MNKYKAIKIDGVKRDEHRYIMEQHLGRKLSRNEVVHHVNGNSKDNRLENLTVMARSEHTHLHQINHPVSDHNRKMQSERMTGQPNMACRKLSIDDVHYIKAHYIPRDKEFGLRALSKKFNIDHSDLSRIIHGERYKNVD